MSIRPTLDKLFIDAKAKDEFEFTCTLINYKGAGSPTTRSNQFEWFNAISFYESLFRSPDRTLHEKARLALMIYCTFFESSDLYTMLGNLARVVLGYRATPYLYWKHEKANRWFGTAEKISMVEEVLIDSGFEDIQKFFQANHFEQIRHSFFHSTYAFDDDEYVMHDVKTLYIDNFGHPTLSISGFIFPRVESVLDFFHSFKGILDTHIKSYTTDKVVQGRMPDLIPIKILGSDQGLIGFHDSRGGSIELKSDLWMATNIRFHMQNDVDRHVGDELQRLFNKTKISTNDGALQRLYEIITERNRPTEKEDLATVYARFGTMILGNAEGERNHFKRASLHKNAKAFFDKMTELSPGHYPNNDRAIANFMVGQDKGDPNLIREAMLELIAILRSNIRKAALTNISVMIKHATDHRITATDEITEFKKILYGSVPEDLADYVTELRDQFPK